MASICSWAVASPAPVVLTPRWVAPTAFQAFASSIQALRPGIDVQRDAAFEADAGGVPAGLVGVTADAVDHLAAFIAQGKQRKPAVGEPRDAAHGHVEGRRTTRGTGADPDRDRALHRQRLDAGMADPVPLALIIDNLLRPQQAQHLDLLLAALAARTPVLVQRLVFDRIPADANAQPQTPAAEHVNLRRLLGHQRRLPLRQDDDAGWSAPGWW